MPLGSCRASTCQKDVLEGDCFCHWGCGNCCPDVEEFCGNEFSATFYVSSSACEGILLSLENVSQLVSCQDLARVHNCQGLQWDFDGPKCLLMKEISAFSLPSASPTSSLCLRKLYLHSALSETPTHAPNNRKPSPLPSHPFSRLPTMFAPSYPLPPSLAPASLPPSFSSTSPSSTSPSSTSPSSTSPSSTSPTKYSPTLAPSSIPSSIPSSFPSLAPSSSSPTRNSQNGNTTDSSVTTALVGIIVTLVLVSIMGCFCWRRFQLHKRNKGSGRSMQGSLLERSERPRSAFARFAYGILRQRELGDSESDEDEEDLRQTAHKAREQQEARERAESAREKKAMERERRSVRAMKKNERPKSDLVLPGYSSGDKYAPVGSLESRESVDAFGDSGFVTHARLKRTDSW